MAIFKVLNAAGKYSDPQALEEVIAYITQPCKTPHHFIGGIGIDLNNIAQSMEKVSIKFGKNSGVRVRHFVLSFLPNELNSYNHIVSIAEQICNFIANEY